MQGKKVIIDQLNALLAYELAAMDQYFIHSQMYQDWGFSKLYTRISHEFDDEKGHATKLIERMLFLEGTPNMVDRDGLMIGSDVPSMLESDLRVEYAVAQALKDTISICETEQDYVTRDMLMILLDDTEMDHAYWLEQQIGLIKRLGLANYLQSQM
ncbi:bacterioferritin [Paraglaciecola sp. MB-3u-78]|uniref:bacterioferritin n=1 Tax=Paraglaciecola sp. MB-3u-78 TaxID=2058332 RepID=UPI000C338B03|nr:bacterioferritin [Paraglaciecola sp. MB-3u-78]PKG99494.1 bacterioferritin [Paraglaciecola sp. MB-3u-78]